MAPSFVIDSMTVNNSDWNPVIAAVTAESFVINNIAGPDDLLVSHDPAGVKYTRVRSGSQWSVPLPPNVSRSWFTPRIRIGTTVAYIKSTTSSPREVEVTYVF